LLLVALVGLSAGLPLADEIRTDLPADPAHLVRLRRQKLDDEPEEEIEDASEVLPANRDPPATPEDDVTSRQEKQIPILTDPDEEVATVDEIEPESDRMGSPEQPKRKFVFHPYFGFVPATATSSARRTYVYDPYYGFVPSKSKSGEAADDGEKDEVEYHYDPYYGYVPASDAGPEPERYVYHSYYGFVPESRAKKLSKGSISGTKFVYSPYYGFVPAKEDSVDAMTKDVQDVADDVLTRVSDAVDAVTKEVKGDAEEEVDADTKEVREKVSVL
jgi:hypothetical protein